jgi:CRP/FNR family transcriptional regulator, cyclic AMP receptor protein
MIKTQAKTTRSRESKRRQRFDFESFMRTVDHGKLLADYGRDDLIFSQGDTCSEICYLEQGNVKLSILSRQGKEAVVAIASRGQFFGEDCLIGRPVYTSTATAMTYARVVKFEKEAMQRLLQRDQGFLSFFTSCLLARTLRIQDDLLSCLINGSEQRLARILLVLAQLSRGAKTAAIKPRINQETLAAMVGTTRPRVNYFLRKFRKSGHIDYDGGLRVHRSLVAVLEE